MASKQLEMVVDRPALFDIRIEVAQTPTTARFDMRVISFQPAKIGYSSSKLIDEHWIGQGKGRAYLLATALDTPLRDSHIVQRPKHNLVGLRSQV